MDPVAKRYCILAVRTFILLAETYEAVKEKLDEMLDEAHDALTAFKEFVAYND
jgi:hypothetical protein